MLINEFYKNMYAVDSVNFLLKRTQIVVGDISLPFKYNVRIYGNVPKDDVEDTRKKILKIYNLFGDVPHYVEISFFEDDSFIREVNLRESKTIKHILSLEPTLFSTVYPASAHAWFDYPSIGINIALFSQLTPDIKVAWLERIVAHTILHNTMASYNIQRPLLFSRLQNLDFLDKQIVEIGFKLFLSSTYEYEISKYLVNKRILESQIKFFLHYLTVSPKEREGIKANERILDIQFLTLLDRFIFLFGATPFYLKTSDKGLLEKIESNLSLFPSCVYQDLWQLLKSYLPMLTFDTQKNVDFLLPRIIWIIQKIDRCITV